MRWIKLLIVAALVLLIAAYGVLFSIENDTAVAVNLLFLQLPELQLSLWLLAAFALGGVGGLLAGSVGLLRARAQHLAVSRRLLKAERELDTLRGGPLKS